MKNHFRIQPSVLMLALAAAYPALGYGAAGTAQFTSGEVTVKRGSAPPAPLAKGAIVESGDSIVTGPRGLAQVKFSDGGYVAIQPNSQFDLTRYADAGNASQDNFLVSLARGGMRAITGLIGKRNTANYKVTTNTATVGIRGSAFNLAYNADGTLSVATEQDAIEVCTAAGCIGLTAGESALVNSNQRLPERTNSRPSVPLAPYRQDPQVAGNQVNSDGTSGIIPTGPRVFTGIAFAGAGLNAGEGYYYPVVSEDGALTLQGGGATAYLGRFGGQGEATGTTTSYYTAGSLANGDFMTLGSWSAGSYTDAESASVTSYAPFAFAAGSFTPEATLNSLSGVTAEYNLVAATPVFTTGGSNPGNGTLLGGSIGINFNGGYSDGSISLDMSLPYQGNSRTSNVTGSVSGSGSQIYGYASGGDVYNLDFRGFFGGANAQSIGLAYKGSTSYNGDITGAAVFGSAGIPTYLPGTYSAVIAYDYDGSAFSGSRDEIQVIVDSSDNSLVKVLQYDSSSAYSNTGTITMHSTVGTRNTDDFMSLGTWSSARYVETGESSYTENYGKYSFVIGTPTSSDTINSFMGMTGVWNLNSSSHASPVFMTNSEIGTLTSAQLELNFSSQYSGQSSGNITMGLSLGTLGSQTLSGSVNGNGSGFNGSLSLTGAEGGYGSVNGFLGGSSGQYAGISYEGHDNLTGIDIGGAAILTGSGPQLPYTPVVPDDGTYSGLTTIAFGPGLTDALTVSGDHTFSSFGPVEATEGSKNYSGASLYTADGSGSGSEFIGWGQWSGGTAYDGSSISLNGTHYVVGTPTSNFQMGQLTGTFNYSRIGNTNPTSTVAGTGTLDYATLTANFSSSTASASVGTSFLGGTLTAAMSADMPITGASFSGPANLGASGKFAGSFYGDAAGKAGFVYQMTSGPLGTVSGAVAFTKN